MKTVVRSIVLLSYLALLAACSVISSDVRRQAVINPSLPILAGSIEAMRGKIAVLGGYVVSVRRSDGLSEMTVLQTPLGMNDEPRARDYSQGRFILRQAGVLDPELYKADRRVTVAGTIIGLRRADGEQCLEDCLVLENIELHVWPEYKYVHPYPFYDPFCGPSYGDIFIDCDPYMRWRPYPYYHPIPYWRWR